jgi:E3 ubiquitin-protein ligase HECTD1
VLEVTARAITYYLDVSAECTRRIVAVEGAVKAMCTRLEVVDLSNRSVNSLTGHSERHPFF